MPTRHWPSSRAWLPILQILLLLPVTAIGSACVPSHGPARVEFGVCACEEAAQDSGGLEFAAAAAEPCGPCHDHALTAAGLTRPHVPAPPRVSAQEVSLLGDLERYSDPTPPKFRRQHQPPGHHPFILRC